MKKSIVTILILGILAVGVFFSSFFVQWIPTVNNILLVVGFILFLALEIYVIKTIWKIDFKKYGKAIKYVLTIILVVFALAFQYFLFLASIFSINDIGNTFTYQDQMYYYINEGFIDPIFVIYRKNGPFTMEEVYEYTEVWLDEEIVNTHPKEIIEGRYRQ